MRVFRPCGTLIIKFDEFQTSGQQGYPNPAEATASWEPPASNVRVTLREAQVRANRHPLWCSGAP